VFAKDAKREMVVMDDKKRAKIPSREAQSQRRPGSGGSMIRHRLTCRLQTAGWFLYISLAQIRRSRKVVYADST
jgi:hypothetical protein